MLSILAYVGDGDLSLILVVLGIIALGAAVYFAVARRALETALVCLVVGVVILILA